MAFCPYCGGQIGDGMRFCPACGREQVAQTVVTPVVTAQTVGTYRVVLLSCGTCTKTDTRELLHDLLGYTLAQAKELTDVAPVEIACGLTIEQAVSISQTFTEYGVQVGAYNNNEYVDLSGYATSSVFDNDGSLLEKVWNVLDTISTANHVKRAVRFTFADPFRHVFVPRYTRRVVRPVLPALMRRPPIPRPPKPPIPGARFVPAPPPRPAPRPAARPVPPPPVRPAPAPGPRPGIAPRPMPGARLTPGPKPGRGGRGPGR